MSESNETVSRRQVLEMLLATGGVLAVGTLDAVLPAEITRSETANMVLGPFYPQVKPHDQDIDLTMVRGRRDRAAGQAIRVRGRVLNLRGEPVHNARVEIWQTNTHGRYAHSSDPNVSAPLDPNFQGYGVQHTDSDGFYSFTTIKPGPYPSSDSNWMRAPHIHFDIQGQVDRKVTQLYFPNEPLNDQDRLLQVVRGDRKTLFAEVTPAVAGTSELLVKWDVILKSG